MDAGDARVTVELRTLNHRWAELRLRLPQALAPEEGEIRRRVLERIKRGRVELSVNVEARDGQAGRSCLDLARVEEVVAAAQALRERYRIEGALDLRTVLAVPGALKAGPPELPWSEPERRALADALGAALDALDRARREEGEHLRVELASRLAAMARITAEVRACAAGLPALLRDRLIERLAAVKDDVTLDPGRVAQEAALLAERADVTEELVRLDGHLDRARALVEHPDGEPLGKRLDFLLQEIQREVNTLGAKAPDLELSRLALALKGEIEKLREQVQNVE